MKRNDGNELDFRLNPQAPEYADAVNANVPVGYSQDCTQTGNQTDLPTGPTGPTGPTLPAGYPDQDVFDPFVIGAQACACGGFDLLLLDQFFMAVLVQHFSNVAAIQDPYLKNYPYTQGPGTKLWIGFNTTWNTVNAGTQPSIIIKRGQQKANRLVINDHAQQPTVTPYSFMQMVQGTHTLLLSAAVDGFAERLAREVFYLFMHNAPLYRSNIYTPPNTTPARAIPPFLDFQVPLLGELGMVDGVGSSFVVPVQIVYAYEYSWKIDPTATSLALLNIQTQVN